MITYRVPGKLFIAGEYAVVNAGHPAVLVAVDRFIEVNVQETIEAGSILSSLELTQWTRENKVIKFHHNGSDNRYITESMRMVDELVVSLNKDVKIYDLTVNSELENQDGVKIGLGSSAAITVATICALLELYEIKYDDWMVFKLSSLVHLRLGSNGSFGDIAASTFTGWIHYEKFDQEWLLSKIKTMSLSEILEISWKQCVIRHLTPLSDYQLVVGWTHSPASSHKLVDLIDQQTPKESYTRFLKQSADCVNQMIVGFHHDDGQLVTKMINKNRRLLRELSPHIETTKLNHLIENANKFGAAKTSGAGGGDCGIALVHKSVDVSPMVREWESFGIEKLELKVYDKSNKKETKP